jgi:hypothetical protein
MIRWPSHGRSVTGRSHEEAEQQRLADDGGRVPPVAAGRRAARPALQATGGSLRLVARLPARC